MFFYKSSRLPQNGIKWVAFNISGFGAQTQIQKQPGQEDPKLMPPKSPQLKYF